MFKQDKFTTNDELVHSLNVSDVTKDVMKSVNRRNFIGDWSHPLIDKPQRIMKAMLTVSLDKTTLENQTILFANLANFIALQGGKLKSHQMDMEK